MAVVALSSAEAIDTETIVAIFDDKVVAASVSSPADWEVDTISPGATSVAVLTATPVSWTVVVLKVHPHLIPGADYTVRARHAVPFDVVDPAASSSQANFTVPGPGAIPLMARSFDGFEALMHSIGRQLQRLAGAAETVLLADLKPGDQQAVLESTLGFANSGAFSCSGRRFTYTGRSDGGVTGLVAASVTNQILAAGSVVTHDERAVLPSDADVPA